MKKLCLLICIWILLTVCPYGSAETNSPALRVEYADDSANPEYAVCLVLNEEASGIAVIPEITLYTLTVEELIWEGEGLSVYPVWSGPVNAKEILCLKAYPDGVFPRFRLRVQVSPGREEERWYLVQSGEDGSLILEPSQDAEVYLPFNVPAKPPKHMESAEKKVRSSRRISC